MLNSMSEEQWAPIPGLSDYMASNHGRVRRISRDQIVPQHVGNKLGHRRVSVKPDGQSYRGMYVHRLVLMAFRGVCPEGMQGCHNDGNPSNNELSNLRWDTAKANQADRARHGTHQNANRTHCPKGHPLDAVKYHADGTFWQRRCRTCLREQNRARKARKTTCPQGHPFDGIAYKPDGTVRQRFCKQCRSDSVTRSLKERHAKAREAKTHCPEGHLLDGVHKRRNAPDTKYCKTCRNERVRQRYAEGRSPR